MIARYLVVVMSASPGLSPSARTLSLGDLDRHKDNQAKSPVRIRAHSAAHLATIWIDYLNLPYAQWTTRRKKALRDFDRWQNNWNTKCTAKFTILDTEDPVRPSVYPPDFYVPTTNEMTTLVKLINHIFFGGLLDVDFSWHPNLSSNSNGTLREKNARVGQMKPLDEDDLTSRVTVWLDPAPHVVLENSDHRFRVVDTLLHECVHAFFGLYACQSDTCPCIQQINIDLGLTGHGAAWLQI